MGLKGLGIRVQGFGVEIQGLLDRTVLLANELDLGMKVFGKGTDMPFEVIALLF
jgi:hypothetical protein